ncbi:DUF6610 family protein [Pedobacter caeni]|uniref:Uncharacterized protein n=1 Tax=Pedobacter caeni TaxID=288992 RepID=A0A1M5JNV8_9SPHI|nr:DUF6610 family protein [Pedobacter caeni]SHG42208.1 hypothetical protein SAMN04488522_105448 [Pedobacter caeni]
MKPLRFATHSSRVQNIAIDHGWLPSARYTNLRDIKTYNNIGFIDIDFKNYSFQKHLDAVKKHRPHLTVARDVFNIEELDQILAEARQLNLYSEKVIIVPKDIRFAGQIEKLIPLEFILGYSVPTKYGGTQLDPSEFKRPTHLLGGRPDVQRALAEKINVYSFDCNRFTLDASFGDYFTGSKFIPHPYGGYDNCIHDSILNINKLWI